MLPDTTMNASRIEADAQKTPAADGEWVRVTSLEALEAEGRLLFRREGRQIVLFDTPDGVRACNNRCPHEGYPLREGSLDDRCVVTCNWHNWKFDLRTGENLYGGERLRTYPVTVRDGDVWIDLADPPFAEHRAAILASLREACEDNAYERIAREIARLHRLGADPLDALRDTIAWSAERMEFGWTHACAGIADWLALYDEREGDDETRLVCVLEGVAHVADDVLREPRHPFPGSARDYDEEAFVDAIESGRNAPYTNGETDLDAWRVEDHEAFFEHAIEGLFDHGVGEFIVSVHLLKTVMAAREELRAEPPVEVAELIAAGVNRFLNSRLKRKQVRRSVYQAMKFVAHDG